MDHAQTIALYQPTLQAIAFKILKCKADAEDVVQDTFVKWLNAEHEKIQNTKAYLVRAVTNNCLNHLEAIKRKKQEYFDAFQWPEFVDRIRDTDFSYSDVEVELNKAFHILQHKLEPLERAVYVLKEAFDFDYNTLQSVLDRKQEHCRQLFCRARKKIQAEKVKFNELIDEKSAMMRSFRISAEIGSVGEVIQELKKDIALALQKKN